MKQFIARLREKQSFYAYTDENLSDLPQLLDRLERLEKVAQTARNVLRFAPVIGRGMPELDDALAALDKEDK